MYVCSSMGDYRPHSDDVQCKIEKIDGSGGLGGEAPGCNLVTDPSRRRLPPLAVHYRHAAICLFSPAGLHCVLMLMDHEYVQTVVLVTSKRVRYIGITLSSLTNRNKLPRGIKPSHKEEKFTRWTSIA